MERNSIVNVATAGGIDMEHLPSCRLTNIYTTRIAVGERYRKFASRQSRANCAVRAILIEQAGHLCVVIAHWTEKVHKISTHLTRR